LFDGRRSSCEEPTGACDNSVLGWEEQAMLNIRTLSRRRHLSMAVLLVFELLSAMAQADEPCVITNETDNFAIVSIQQDPDRSTTITWESCTNYIYGVLSADQPDTGTFWLGQIAMWGEDRATSWTDTTTTNVDHRFYRVVRMPADGDFDDDGMPNAWELQYGLNPLDPSDAQTDLDDDGVDNLT
jgi:hypothetical protein